jgi:hypothetical protein
MKDRAQLFTLCIVRAGYLDGARLIEFIEEWRRGVDHAEGEITTEEFIRWTRRFPRRTVARRLTLFRRTFPQLGPAGLPSGLMGPLLERLARESEAEAVVS